MEEVKAGKEIQLVTFKLKNEEFGINVHKVDRINRFKEDEVTKVPKAPDYIIGVVNRMGRILPVVDLRRRLGFEPKPSDKYTRVIDYRLEDDSMVGFMVDEVTGVKRIYQDQIEPSPPIIAGIESEYISGICRLDEGLIILLDLDRLLTPAEKEKLKEVVK